MDFSRQNICIRDVKDMDMVAYLSQIGIEPSRIKGNDFWYHSPLREEKTPSFKIDRRLNRWYDHGIGRGGNLIDFAVLFYNCSVKDFLQKLHTDAPFHQPITRPKIIEKSPGRLQIIQEFAISSYALIQYLENRKIPVAIASRFCREVRFNLKGKTYFAIGLKNNAGGYEIRSSFFKLSSHPKDFTTIKNGVSDVAVFEGFFDFLSYLVLMEKGLCGITDFIILNSLSFFEKARSIMESYQQISLFLDNDEAGQYCSRNALAISKKYADKSGLYENYKDLNHWLKNELDNTS